MKPEEMIDAVGRIKEDFIEAADKTRVIKKKFPWKRVVAVAACLCVVSVGIAGIFGILSKYGNKGGSTISGTDDQKYVLNTNEMEKISGKFVLTEAKYPVMTVYPDFEEYTDYDEYDKMFKQWKSDKNAQENQYSGYNANMEKYYENIVTTLMSGNHDKNIICSPLNIYMALSMLAEVSDGSSRTQILDVMEVDNVKQLRKKVAALWNANYCNDGRYTSLLGNSLWLNEGITFKSSTLDTLSNSYYASVYSGKMGDSEFTNAYRTWLNNHTGGLLKDSINDLKLEANLAAVMASTIYFSARWNNEFSDDNTITDIFHGINGDVNSQFLTEEEGLYLYYDGDGYSAVSLPFEETGEMLIILPDKDSSVANLAENEEAMDIIVSSDSIANLGKFKNINLKIPRFDVSSSLSLIDSLKGMGITDVFNSLGSDFAMKDGETFDLHVSEILHNARVKIDEEGCEAAAFTIIAASGSVLPDGQVIDFIADRPFMFVIKGTDGSVLFTGVVNNPQN